MNKIQELRNKRLETWEKAKTFLEDKRDEKGIVSAEDTAAYEKMEAGSCRPRKRNRQARTPKRHGHEA
jgi:hypothetical protein